MSIYKCSYKQILYIQQIILLEYSEIFIFTLNDANNLLRWCGLWCEVLVGVLYSDMMIPKKLQSSIKWNDQTNNQYITLMKTESILISRFEIFGRSNHSNRFFIFQQMNFSLFFSDYILSWQSCNMYLAKERWFMQKIK